MLAYWHASFGRYEKALENAVFLRVAAISRDDEKARVLLEADCHMALGQRARARFLMDQVMARHPRDTDFQLAAANTYANYDGQSSPAEDAERLRASIASSCRTDWQRSNSSISSRPLCMDNIRGAKGLAVRPSPPRA